MERKMSIAYAYCVVILVAKTSNAQCTVGTYLSYLGFCSSCSINCNSCTSYFDCKTCYDGGFYQYVGLLGGIFCSKCPQNCSKCTNQSYCSECESGYFSTTCGYSCSMWCVNGECTKDNCTRGCIDGYYQHFAGSLGYCFQCKNGCAKCTDSEHCSACQFGFYIESYTEGNYVCQQCPARSNDVLCSQCSVNSYRSGSECVACSNNCVNSECWPEDGVCLQGCKDNWTGPQCTTCQHDYYGDLCQTECNTHCKRQPYVRVCDTLTGSCLNCEGGFWGQCCNASCELGCFGKICNKENGQCDTCNSAYYGAYCENLCHKNCATPEESSTVCNKLDGRCLFGCLAGYTGDTCSQAEDSTLSTLVKKTSVMTPSSTMTLENTTPAEYTTLASTESHRQDDDMPFGVTAGAAAGALVLLIVGVVCFVIWLRRRNRTPIQGNGKTNTATSVNDTNEHAGPIYALPNKVKKNNNVPLSIVTIHPGSEPPALPIRLSIPYDQETDVDAGDIVEEVDEDSSTSDVVNVLNDPMTDTYYNIAGLKRSRIPIDKVQKHVDQKTDFEKEFQKLPKGLTRPYAEACKPANRPKNRYRGIYPYDVSRVNLITGDSDFINASYIDGYNKTNAYIASLVRTYDAIAFGRYGFYRSFYLIFRHLGPTSQHMGNFVTFWRMVWQEKVETIVMLTNLMEGEKMKCEKYWPDIWQGSSYGDINVMCQSEDIYAEYTVRRFTVSKRNEKRSLYHIHYTAWPDRSVPDDITSLIEYMQKVQSLPRELDGPVIVHCSAGVGRTGTYIGLDVLTAEGKAEKSVDIFGCVMGMRGQRVNMVQTAEQYQYLHNAVVHALTFDCHSVKAEEFKKLVSVPTRIAQTEKQFEVFDLTANRKPEDEVDAIARNIQFRDKNRKGAAIPGDRYRPRLPEVHEAGPLCYINAVYVNSFKSKESYIAAQTPLPCTVVDFLRLVIQENVSCIVTLDPDNLHDKTVGTYLPAANQVLKQGTFKISCKKCESASTYILRELVIQHLERCELEEITVYHFQFNQWKKDQPVPSDPDSFVQLVKDVERTDNEAGLNGPIMVHCLTGGERSGLFCAVSVLIQKIEVEHEVSVVNTVRQITTRRGNAIPNKEQYIFCHQCVCTYLSSTNVYANV